MLAKMLKNFSDDFRVTTWLLIGATLQACLFLLPVRVAVAPTILLLLSRVAYYLMVRAGLVPDRSRATVAAGRRAAQLPLPDGSFADTPADQDVVVLILAAQSNQ
jgi:hypothetical protein